MNDPVRASYRERLRAAINDAGNPLCAGIDPDLFGLTGFRQRMLQRDGAEAFLKAFGEAVIEAASGKVPAVKLQSAYFEVAGAAGMSALAHLITLARRRKLIVILDAKRGDIADTMRAYGRAAFDTFGADALTVTPYMGLDVALPLLPWLSMGRGMYVVWVTSNPAGSVLQGAALQNGQSVASHLLGLFHDGLAAAKCDDAWGVVYGATKADALSAQLARALKDRPLLIPGIGAQGGQLTGALRQLVQDGGLSLVNVSRGLMPEETADSASWDWSRYAEGIHGKINEHLGKLSF